MPASPALPAVTRARPHAPVIWRMVSKQARLRAWADVDACVMGKCSTCASRQQYVVGVECASIRRGQSHGFIPWLERRNLRVLPIGASALRMLLAELDQLRASDSIGEAEQV